MKNKLIIGILLVAIGASGVLFINKKPRTPEDMMREAKRQAAIADAAIEKAKTLPEKDREKQKEIARKALLESYEQLSNAIQETEKQLGVAINNAKKD